MRGNLWALGSWMPLGMGVVFSAATLLRLLAQEFSAARWSVTTFCLRCVQLAVPEINIAGAICCEGVFCSKGSLKIHYVQYSCTQLSCRLICCS